MADQQSALHEEGAKVRKERVHTTMLIELLVTLIFLAMAYAFVEKDEMHFDTIKQELADTKVKLQAAEDRETKLILENYDLAKENKELKLRVARLLRIPPDRLIANPNKIPPTPAEVELIKQENANLSAQVAERDAEIAKLRAKLIQVTGGKAGGNDLPNCSVTAGYLLRIDLEAGDTYRVTPAWREGADTGKVTGLSQLVAAQVLSADKFSSLTNDIANWGLKEANPCRFRVTVFEHYADLELYKHQMANIERNFYAKRN